MSTKGDYNWNLVWLDGILYDFSLIRKKKMGKKGGKGGKGKGGKGC